uniref:T-box transcription factor TBX6-like isoform X3 n=1 Tax=Gasterosteus aculeatus aculeatus TaxID=481459 RepID=UPI001A9A115B|nr:T-box transcription factor TBX6-like isoform X3 [Gasterosteus aculeatus aculeatus]
MSWGCCCEPLHRPSRPLDVRSLFMASKKKQRAMVFHQGGSTIPAATNHPAARLPIPKLGRVSDGGTEPNPHVAEEDVAVTDKPNGIPLQEDNWTSGGFTTGKCSAGSNPKSDNLSPVIVCRGIRVTLDNNGMWNEFFRCKTEMILTKQGSRMFPYCRFRISGLQPSKKYSLYMDIQPLDGSRYRWTGKSWQVAGKAEGHVTSRPFAHPESPSTGQHWMQSPVSFYKLKLTNGTSDLEGNTVLRPMHRYLPRMHVVQTDTDAKDMKLTGPAVVTFAFHQTAFMAVTTYQNSRFSQLKVDYNPFAKGLKEDASGGLKLKLISGKDGGAAADEQHPVKKSLKSLLANYKPRSTKAADAKLSESSDPERNSTSNDGQSAAKASEESLCGNFSPAQKLFSELIREAHVSLQRCNLNQLGIDNRSEQSNNKTTALKSHGPYDRKGDGGTIVTKRKVREDNSPSNSVNSKDATRTDCSGLSNAGLAGSCNSSADSDPQLKAKAPSEAKLKQHKRPLPLPALARFLRQHSSKSRLAKSKPDSPLPAPPTECRSLTECPPSDHGSKANNLADDDATPARPQASGHSEPRVHLEEVLNVTGLAAETGHSCSNAVSSTDPEGPDDFLTSDLVAKSGSPDGTPALLNSYQLSLISTSPPSSLAASPVSLPPHNAELPAENSSLCPLDLPKSDPPLPDPELSLFGFEPPSPTISPEPLPSLPVSFALELHSAVSQVTLKAASPEVLGEDPSVFKWHTVLPPAEAYVDPSFTTFQPAPQILTRTSPLLPLQTPSYPEPQTPDHSTFTSAPDPAPSFEDDEPLPFPAELSPLALQMTLSPTFSSLDGDGLSPTPSIADLVHFFSNDDLGMGVEFSHTDVVAVPCAPLVIEEANPQEPPQQVSMIPTDKPCRNKCRRQKLVNEEDEKMDASTYAKMQPNLEEVEEQLFISFTSKEALRLHVADFSDGTASQPQTTPEGHLQLTAVTPENEGPEESIASFEKILLKDLKQMRHGQAIHPVLQEVGLKMNLLDPTLAIDLQYLGVRLPIPPTGVPLEPLPPTQGAAFVSRTGKTTDFTQIKGWREKFPPSEATSTAAPVNAEATCWTSTWRTRGSSSTSGPPPLLSRWRSRCSTSCPPRVPAMSGPWTAS